MNKDIKHTPTPWKSSGLTIRDFSTRGGRSRRGHLIANCHPVTTYDNCTSPEGQRLLGEANAIHIVKCVNEAEGQQQKIDALVEALSNLIEISETHASHIVRKADIAKGRAAIKLAKGE